MITVTRVQVSPSLELDKVPITEVLYLLKVITDHYVLTTAHVASKYERGPDQCIKCEHRS